MPKLSRLSSLALNLIPLVMDIVGGVKSDEELRAVLKDLEDRLTDVEEHLDRMYLSLRKELGRVQLFLKISLAVNVLLLIILLIVILKVW